MLYKLKDLIETKVSGEWGTEDVDGSGVKVIRTANFTNLGIVDFSKVVKRKIDEKKVVSKRLIKGDVIIEKSGGSPNQPVGRVVFFNPIDEEIYLTNNFTSCLRPNKKIVDPKYFFYLLYDLYRKDVVLKYQNKTTGIINLKLDNYLEEKVNVIEKLSDQIRIAERLSQAEGLIAQRKQSISLLDELLKSIFLEMFGDPLKNERKWIKKKLKDVCIKITDGTHFSPPIIEKGIPYITAKHVRENKIDFWAKPWFISEGHHREIYKRCTPVKGDVLYIKDGATTGYAAINKYDFEFSMLSSLALLKVDSKILTSEYLCSWLNNPIVKAKILEGMSGGAIQRLTLTKINELPINIPPIERQTKFSAVVEKIETLKIEYQRSLTELQNMYGVLSQKAFKGELNIKEKLKKNN